MKIDKFKVRGYEVNHNRFDETDDLRSILGAARLLSVVNGYVIAHEWNSDFENELCKLAEKAGHVRLVTKDEEGKITERETNAKFLTRTGFKLKDSEAQKLADSLAFPPVPKERGEKVDKDLIERMNMAQKIVADTERLTAFFKKCAVSEVKTPDMNADIEETALVEQVAECIRLYRLAI